MFNAKRILCLSAAVIGISGCGLTPSFLGGSGDKDESKVRIYNGTAAIFDDLSDNEKDQLLRRHIQEWESIKPTVNKVVAMESDFTFILSEIQKLQTDSATNSANIAPLTFNDVDTSIVTVNSAQPIIDVDARDAGFNTNTQGLTNAGNSAAQQNANSAFPDSAMLSKFSNSNTAAAATNRTTKTFSRRAPETLTASNFEEAARMLEIDDKFSAQNISSPPLPQTFMPALAQNNEPAIAFAPNSDSLRSTTNAPAQRIIAIDDNCQGDLQPTIDGISVAVHLASYKNKDNIEAASRRFKQKYAQALCKKSAVVKQVQVNGVDFYSLRFGPFSNAEQARGVCSTISSSADYCALSKFDGHSVSL